MVGTVPQQKQDTLLLEAIGAAAKTFFEFKQREWQQYTLQITPGEMDTDVNC